ncbi:MAG: hypothetical protein KGL48_16785 [Sphingomonadales bacterium]|nr:hypothetical protein [Sphingomonadales bacterium]MDE2569001.1 hypothetical protein [Sphingomonadales bacterium]
MKPPITLVAIIAASLPLAGCASTGYGMGMGYGPGGYYPSGYGYGAYPYDGWYDGYYGSIYDGYWGSDGSFYYRSTRQDRDYRRADAQHFRRDHQGNGNGQGWHEMRGTLHYDHGAQMPNFPHDRDHDRQGRHGRRPGGN